MKVTRITKSQRGRTLRNSGRFRSIASGSTRTLARRRWRSSKESKEEQTGQEGLPGLILWRKTMNTNTGSWVSRKKGILAASGIPVLVAGWWAFRPEKLFIKQKVNEAAPAALSAEPEAL